MKVKISVTKLAELLSVEESLAEVQSEYQDLAGRAHTAEHDYAARLAESFETNAALRTENMHVRQLADTDRAPMINAMASMVLIMSTVDLPDATWPDDVVRCITENRKILAIKTLRAAYPALGLRECKMIVDEIARRMI